MDLHHLEYIVEIAKERNISKAAQNLHISQPTLSIYLSKLEQELNLKLFHRANNVLTITEAGQKYAKTCQQILDLKESLYKELYSDKNHVFCMGILSSDAAVFGKVIITFVIFSTPFCNPSAQIPQPISTTRIIQKTEAKGSCCNV